MNCIKEKHGWITLLFALILFLFWWKAYPQALNYQEQNQLFLFTADYLWKDMRIAGGFADYISEFIVQFYYLPWVGALWLSLLFVAIQWFTWKLIKPYNSQTFILSFLPTLLMLWHLGDINTLLSLPVATLFSLVVAYIMKEQKPWLDGVLLPMLYWLIGPASWVYIGLRCLACGMKHLWIIPYQVAIQVLAYFLLLSQWPPEMVMTGLNYYRLPLQLPFLQIAAPLSVVFLSAFIRWLKPHKILPTVSFVIVVVAVFMAIYKGFDRDMYELLKQDELLRKGEWTAIINRAEKKQVETSFSSQCVNLALAMTGQLPERMFEFYQSGTDALLMPMVRDNTSNLPTAEAFYRLGMVNEALRYHFDIQQSILNFKKSGRCTRRIAECYIINGNYRAAAKHLALLRNSLFYRDWAIEATAYLNRDDKVNTHSEWGKIRRLRFKDQFLYNYNEKDKMLGLLFMNQPENKPALFYFMGQLLLDGNIQVFTNYLKWVQQYGGFNEMPKGYADALQCIQMNGNLPGSDYANYVVKMKQNHE